VGTEGGDVPGTYCRGCGLSKERLGLADPRHCKRCGPLLVHKRRFCEHCGAKLSMGLDPCPECKKAAYRFYGR
jgi:predicted amidophosphoribosyltransferase